MNKLIAFAAALAVATVAASPAAAREVTPIDGTFSLAKSGDCVFRSLDGARTAGWCPDWSADKADCIFRTEGEGGGFGWCPDWNGAAEDVVADGSCVFSPVEGSAGSVAWCPDWLGDAVATCVFSGGDENNWCPDWLGVRTEG